ncbi:DNA cytosine methyltransferase [Muricauda ruestringensis]|uniref:DNA (cytosine-5-)-methyltransferase n=1 Tax=Flagellimonas aurea TaxID=2915619 RepID=A0ABS3GAA3_9FLAO|nr:DNA cytosine methyltransferase [Allomuricauda aurea]MBO0356218.1 DNA cytosine methyltransferase [Allomuricauda aurea]
MGKKEQYSVVDLFCGIGGLTRGFLDKGFNVTAGVDIDQDCKYAYEKNNKATFIEKSVSELSPEYLKTLFLKGTRKILIGCAPCQPFSIFNQKSSGTVSEMNSERWKLLYAFADLIKEVKPEIVSMENVPLLKSFKNGKVLSDFEGVLKGLGYYVSTGIFDSQYYGVPQRRKRLVLLASLNGPIEMLPYTHLNKVSTVRKAIGKLPKIQAGEIHHKDLLHRSRQLNELSLRRIKATPEGGSWKDWDEELIADCHKNDGGKAYGSAYGRMKWDDVAPTMTTYCIGYNNGRFGHPEQDRAISLREAAILQSFPKNYDFVNPKKEFSSGRIAKQIGNAVPVKLGQAIAMSVANHIEKYNNE